jgi:hypothetical protein
MTWQHGDSGYENYGCRCDTCRSGHAQAARAYRQRRKARRGERMLRGYFVKETRPGKERPGLTPEGTP